TEAVDRPRADDRRSREGRGPVLTGRGRRGVSPGIAGVLEPAPSRALPLRLGGEPVESPGHLAEPAAVKVGVAPRDPDRRLGGVREARVGRERGRRGAGRGGEAAVGGGRDRRPLDCERVDEPAMARPLPGPPPLPAPPEPARRNLDKLGGAGVHGASIGACYDDPKKEDLAWPASTSTGSASTRSASWRPMRSRKRSPVIRASRWGRRRWRTSSGPAS